MNLKWPGKTSLTLNNSVSTTKQIKKHSGTTDSGFSLVQKYEFHFNFPR